MREREYACVKERERERMIGIAGGCERVLVKRWEGKSLNLSLREPFCFVWHTIAFSPMNENPNHSTCHTFLSFIFLV